MADRPGPIENARGLPQAHGRRRDQRGDRALPAPETEGRLGQPLGHRLDGAPLLATMQAEGIDCSQRDLRSAAQRTGFSSRAARDSDGSDPPVEYHRKGSAASQMGPADVDEAWLRSARHLHATGACSPRSPDTSLQAALKTMGGDARRGPHDLVRHQPAADAVGLDRRPCLRYWINELAARSADWCCRASRKVCC